MSNSVRVTGNYFQMKDALEAAACADGEILVAHPAMLAADQNGQEKYCLIRKEDAAGCGREVGYLVVTGCFSSAEMVLERSWVPAVAIGRVVAASL